MKDSDTRAQEKLINVSSSSIQSLAIDEASKLTLNENVQRHMYQNITQLEEKSAIVEDSGNFEYGFGKTRIARQYWEKQCGHSDQGVLMSATLQQWIVNSSSKNGGISTITTSLKKSVGRRKQSAENVKYHQCVVCGKSVQRLGLHMRMHTGDRPYQCSQCGHRFTQLGSLKKHQTLHTEDKPFRCNGCGKSFRCKSDLSLHSKLHTGGSFDCTYCSKSFVTQKAIDNHLRIHTGEKPYLCHVCGFSFSQEGNLSMHLKVHMGDKPFKCSACSKFFATRTHLDKHSRTHTREKPYTCDTCRKSFSDRGYLMRHIAVHTGEKAYLCTVCNKSFTQGISLKRHSRIHSGEKPFECMICWESFSLKRDLKRHGEKVHNINKSFIPMKEQLLHSQHFTTDMNDRNVRCHYQL